MKVSGTTATITRSIRRMTNENVDVGLSSSRGRTNYTRRESVLCSRCAAAISRVRNGTNVALNVTAVVFSNFRC